MAKRQHTSLIGLLALTLLTACTSSIIDYQASGIVAPKLWSRLPASANTPLVTDATAQVENNWWKHFNDPTLDALIAEALQNNKTLAIAKARVEEARAGRAATQATLYPQVNGAVDTARGNLGLSTEGQPATTDNANVLATWEVDLFGKNQARASAANAILQSEEATQQAVLVALLADVARHYFDLCNYQRQIAITQQNLDNQYKTLQLTQAQLQGALASNFDVQRAGAQVSTTESQLPALQSAYEAALNRLNVLLGHAPGEKDTLMKTEARLQPLDPHIIVAAPATVIATRPDIHAAERRFAASIAVHEAATRELFPTVSLLGLFGVQDTRLFSTSPTWNIGANLTSPILNFGRIQADIDASDASQQQAFLSYQQTVLEALENMENALTQYLHETARNVSLMKAAEQNRTAVELAKQQYTSGYTSLLDVLVVEHNALDAESSLASSDIQLRKDLVNIYAAAGGGWSVPSF